MQEIVKIIFLFLIGTTVLNLVIALLARVKTKASQFNTLILYWISLFATYFAAAVLSQNNEQIAFAYFFQILPTFLTVKMLHDSRGKKLNISFFGIFWAISAALSAYLITSTNLGFTTSLLPVTFATTIIYFPILKNTLVTKRHSANWIEKAMAWVFVSGVINHWTYAFFRLDENSQFWGWGVSIGQYQCLSIFLPLLINHQRAELERKNIQQALDKLSGTNSLASSDTIEDLYRNLEIQIHQRDLLTKELKKSNESLKEEQETNEILIKTVSHDLANPLTVVNAYIDMMLSGRINPDDFKSTIIKIKNSSNSALDMISRIRDAIVTRNQAGIINLHNVSVERSIQKLLSVFEAKLEAKQITVTYENDVPLDTFVSAEENTLISHVFSNVLSNAIKFSHHGTNIRIKVVDSEECVNILFIDQGVGIDSRRLKARKLLLSTEGTEGEQGTGFGFMIMSYFLRKFGGSYELFSEGTDKGTTATVTLKKSSGYTDKIRTSISNANYLS